MSLQSDDREQVLLTFHHSFGIAGFILINVSKKIQSLFLWGVVTAGYILLLVLPFVVLASLL
ncbi:MAG: hypothetical protein CMJ81_15015 [Planctomycetaceae bacterium]|jgi:hypothetical protein|nr:hypothetical protein [Planctomycetaceae bacterium]MBP61811.1 hypothetical protein [Planctomycetaceae bacterium]